MPYNKTSGCEADICFHSSVHEQIHQSRRDDSAQQREFANALQQNKRLRSMLSCLAHFLNELLMFSSLNSYHFAFVF